MEEKTYQEKLAFCQITEHLKEKEKIKIEKKRHRTNGEDPPDFDFEIGSDKIGCEVVRFHLVNVEDKSNTLEQETAIRGKIEKEIERRLDEKGIPPLTYYPDFCIDRRIGNKKNAETIANAIAAMHKETITDSREFELKNPKQFHRLFIKTEMANLEICYMDPLVEAAIGQEYWWGTPDVVPLRFRQTIEPGEMQDVIDKKNKPIPCWKVCCDRKWLIITNYETTGSFTLTDEVKETRYTHNFDRVWCIEQGAIYELKKLNQ